MTALERITLFSITSVRSFDSIYRSFSVSLTLHSLFFLSIADRTRAHLLYPWLLFHWIHPQLLLCLFSCNSMCLWRFKQFLLNCFVAGFSFVFYLFKRKTFIQAIVSVCFLLFCSFFQFTVIFFILICLKSGIATVVIAVAVLVAPPLYISIRHIQ